MLHWMHNRSGVIFRPASTGQDEKSSTHPGITQLGYAGGHSAG
jgi:hypothetical protein